MKIIKLYSVPILLLIMVASVEAENSSWTIKSVNEKEVVHEVAPQVHMQSFETKINLRNGKNIFTNLVEVKNIGVVFSKEKIPFLIFSGRNCKECDMNTSIYIHSPLKGDFGPDKSNIRYGYPGKLHFYEDNSLIEESRMFYGSCLDKNEPVIVWYYNNLLDNKTWEKSVIVVEFTNKDSKARLLPEPISRIDTTMKFVKRGVCKEVSGKIITSEP